MPPPAGVGWNQDSIVSINHTIGSSVFVKIVFELNLASSIEFMNQTIRDSGIANVAGFLV